MNTYIRAIRPLTVKEKSALTVSAALAKTTEIVRVTLYYRQFGQSEYRLKEMQVSGDSAQALVPADEVTLPFLETYVLVETQTGGKETFPFENPQTLPFRITVEARSQKELEVIVLSPEEGDQITIADVYISVSTVYAGNNIDRKRTKISLDGVDLSPKAVAMGDLIIVSSDGLPPTIAPGFHRIQVRTFDTTGAPYYDITRNFSIITEFQAEQIRERVQFFGNAQAERRNEDRRGTFKYYNRFDTRANASYGVLRTNGLIHLTNEEKPDQQPQNRYFLGIDARYAKLGLGDAYPQFPTTVMDGRRLRGVTFDLLLGGFNVNAATGDVTRKIAIDDTAHIPVVNSYRRRLTAVRPNFGSGENFQWGFTYLKSKDDFDSTQQSITTPQENAVFGSDMLIALFEHRVEFTGQVGVSLSNVDISKPQWTKADVDSSKSLSESDKKQIKTFLPILTEFITWNDFLQPLDPTGLTSLVYETGLAINFFRNYLKATYVFHGNDYNSFGTTALRRDIKGYNIFDRLRLLENRLFLSANYERLSNNTTGKEIATTTYDNLNSSVSYYPGQKLPNVTLGYGFNKNMNPLNPLDTLPDVASRAIDDITKKYFIQATHDFSFWGRHNATFSFDVANKTDHTPKKQDVKSLNSFLAVSTTHTFPLESTVGFAMSLNTVPQISVDSAKINGRDTAVAVLKSTSLNYQTVTLNARYKMLKDDLRLSGTISPTFGNIARTVFEISAQYAVTGNQSALLQFQFIINSASSAVSSLPSKNESYLSLIYRIDF